MEFFFWLDEEDEEVSVVLSAHDAGGVYQRSVNFVIRFATTAYLQRDAVRLDAAFLPAVRTTF